MTVLQQGGVVVLLKKNDKMALICIWLKSPPHDIWQESLKIYQSSV